jgi:hypothetical protein
VPKRAIKIRNEDLHSCSGEGFDVRVNLATRLQLRTSCAAGLGRGLGALIVAAISASFDNKGADAGHLLKTTSVV